MKRMSAILCLILLCGAAFAAAAAKKAAHPAGGMTLTGCLQKGDEPNTFLLTNATGPGGGGDGPYRRRGGRGQEGSRQESQQGREGGRSRRAPPAGPLPEAHRSDLPVATA